jgi:16S rRNA (guanine527-N7)-methyltransferase
VGIYRFKPFSGILELILKYFQGLEQEQILQLEYLKELYQYWNEKINLISRKDIDHLYERHVLHSMVISKIIQFKPGTTILDIGTGGGFPGIPLSILFPDCKFTLIDSIGKKIKVVNDIIEKLKLTNAEAKHQHSNDLKQKFDFIVSRAVAAFNEFVKLSNGKIKNQNFNGLQNGILYLKGGDLTDEIKEFKKLAVLYPISDYFSEDFFKSKFIVYYPI